MSEEKILNKTTNEGNNNNNNNENNKDSTQILLSEANYLPNIDSKFSKSFRKILRKIEKRKPKNIGSIFDNKRVVAKNTRRGKTYKSFNEEFNNRKTTKDKEIFNVFKHEDHMVKELMIKFKEKNKKDKIPKLIRKRMAFNRLYDITKESKERLKDVKKAKKIFSLEQYQINILKAVDINSIEDGERQNLIQSFNDLRKESDNIQVLPPINIKTIRDHVKNQKKEKLKKSFKEIMNNAMDDLDEFEKEEKMIKDIKSYKSQPKTRRNKNFDMLPDYIREIFTKKLNYHS